MNKYFESITKKNKTLINKIRKDLNHLLDINEEVFSGNFSDNQIAKHVSGYMQSQNKNVNIEYSCGVREIIFRAYIDSDISDYQLKTLVFEKEFNKKTSKYGNYVYNLKTVAIGKRFPEQKLLVEKSFSTDHSSLIFEDETLNIRSEFTLLKNGEVDFFINEEEQKINKTYLSDYIEEIIKQFKNKEETKDLKNIINNYLGMLEDLYSIDDEMKEKVNKLLFEGEPFSEDAKDLLKIIHDISLDENNNNMEKYFSNIQNIKLSIPKPPKFFVSKTFVKYS